jgi:hypothetical protein
MSNIYNKQYNSHPLQPASSADGTDAAGRNISNPSYLTTPTSSRTIPQDESSPAQTPFTTPRNKNTQSSGQTPYSTPIHQATQGKPPVQSKGTSTDPLALPKEDNKTASPGTGNTTRKPFPALSKLEGRNDNHEDGKVNSAQTKRTPLPKRTYTPADLLSGEKSALQDDSAEADTDMEIKQDETKAKNEKKDLSAKKRKATEDTKGKYSEGTEEDRQDIPSSDKTVGPDLEEEEGQFDPTAPVSQIRGLFTDH